MELFVVTQEGVYRHAIVGIFTDVSDAMNAAKKSIQAEPDDHHSYDVSRCLSGGLISDVEPVATVIREKGVVSIRRRI